MAAGNMKTRSLLGSLVDSNVNSTNVTCPTSRSAVSLSSCLEISLHISGVLRKQKVWPMAVLCLFCVYSPIRFLAGIFRSSWTAQTPSKQGCLQFSHMLPIFFLRWPRLIRDLFLPVRFVRSPWFRTLLWRRVSATALIVCIYHGFRLRHAECPVQDAWRRRRRSRRRTDLCPGRTLPPRS